MSFGEPSRGFGPLVSAACAALLLATSCAPDLGPVARAKTNAKASPEKPGAPSALAVPPPPPLKELLPAFEARAARAKDFALSGERSKELSELFDLAEGGEASGRTQARARRSFAQEADSIRVLEDVARFSEDARLRSIAVYALGQRESQASLTILLKRCKYEKDPSARLEIASALTYLGNHSAIPWIRLTIEDATSPLRQRAGQLAIDFTKRYGRAIAENGGPNFAEIEAPSWAQLVDACRTAERAWRRGAALVAGVATEEDSSTAAAPAKPDPKAEAQLYDARLAQLFVQLQGFQLRPVDDARFILTRMGTHGLPELERALGAKEHYLRNHALEVVRDLGPLARRLAIAVRRLLGDRLSRSLACRTLGRIGDRESAPLCIKLLQTKDPGMRAAAAAALGPMGAREAKPQLERLARDETASMDVRVAAATSLALFELERPWAAWLRERKSAGDYHVPQIDEILDRIEARRVELGRNKR